MNSSKKTIIPALFTSLFMATTSHGVIAAEQVKAIPPSQFKNECESRFPTTATEVTLVDSSVTEHHTKSLKQITASARELKTSHAEESYVMGLTRVETSWRLSVEMKSLTQESDNISCLKPAIKIELGLNSHSIDIAKELEYQSCEYNFVRNHEYQHVRINRDQLQRSKWQLENSFNANFSIPIVFGSLETLKDQIEEIKNREWIPFIKNAIKAMENERDNKHKLIDTPEEYAKGNSVCEEKIPEIIRASLNNQSI